MNYDMEQQIMQCWGVVEDIETLRLLRATRTMTEDELDNYLLGVKTLYQVKFELLFDTFETQLRQQAAQKNLP